MVGVVCPIGRMNVYGYMTNYEKLRELRLDVLRQRSDEHT